jgi:hypothetical protein
MLFVPGPGSRHVVFELREWWYRIRFEIDFVTATTFLRRLPKMLIFNGTQQL